MKSNGHLVSQAGAEIGATNRSGDGDHTETSARVHLNGNIARRRVRVQEFFWWDTELPGFGLRTFPGGTKTWIVQFRQRGKQKRITLGRSGEMTAHAARKVARAELAKVALDGLPVARSSARRPETWVLFRDYAPRFWDDYSRHWKPTTQKGNHAYIFKGLVKEFGPQPVDAIRRADILRWRDGCTQRTGAFNRTIPIMSVMMSYAEHLGLRPRGSNPCKGTPRYKRPKMDRFLSPREFKRLADTLRAFEDSEPVAVQVIRLLIYTGARCGEIAGLRWEWVQPPRLMLPDSKTGAKIIYLNSQAMAVLDAMAAHDATGLVFRDPRNNQPVQLGKIWPRIRQHAALPDVRLHDLRHSFASTAIMDGVSLVVIGKLLGHALAETTERYAHLADETIADAAQRISGSLARCLGLAA